jgi:hypothetical protein
MTSPTPELGRLGDDLERATARNLAAHRRRLRAGRAGIAVVALTALATGGAFAAGLFTPKQVAAGMPAGTYIFGNAHPTCALDADGTTYHCTLDMAPQPEEAGATLSPEKAAAVKAAGGTGPVAPDYLGWKEVVVVDGTVAGGCIGRSSDGLKWDCYMGQEAVTQDIIGPDLLGEPESAPGHG